VSPTVKAPKEAFLVSSRMEPGKKRAEPRPKHIKLIGANCHCSSLDALGTLQSKMRIHAKEDVYEAARKNWVAAEQQQKKNW
jgi:RNA polymerase II elongation factor ELL